MLQVSMQSIHRIQVYVCVCVCVWEREREMKEEVKYFSSSVKELTVHLTGIDKGG